MQDLAEQALETVEELLTSEDPNLRLRAAALPAAMEREPDPEPAQSDTIRQIPTLESQPSHNSRCACGSGLKYKRCCSSGPAARSEIRTAA